jgi:hypothetical protein
MAERTNIHAKPHTNVTTAELELELSQSATIGAGPFNAAATLVTAVWVKIW